MYYIYIYIYIYNYNYVTLVQTKGKIFKWCNTSKKSNMKRKIWKLRIGIMSI